MSRSAASIALAGALGRGVRAETGVLPARPPLPLDSMALPGDLRVDSTRQLAGRSLGVRGAIGDRLSALGYQQSLAGHLGRPA